MHVNLSVARLLLPLQPPSSAQWSRGDGEGAWTSSGDVDSPHDPVLKKCKKIITTRNMYYTLIKNAKITFCFEFFLQTLWKSFYMRIFWPNYIFLHFWGHMCVNFSQTCHKYVRILVRSALNSALKWGMLHFCGENIVWGTIEIVDVVAKR